VALVLGACGSRHPIGGDAGMPSKGDAGIDGAVLDAAIDAATIDATVLDAAAGPITVHLLGRQASGTGPHAGVPVLFYGPDGVLAARTTTDALGIARGNVTEGSSVTIVEQAERQLTTIAGVAPGDELSVGDVGFWDPPLRHTAITLPSGPDAGDRYGISGPCASSGLSASPVTTTLWACAPTSGPILATAFEVSDFGTAQLRGYLFAPQVALEDGGTPTITGTWLPPITFDVDVTGLPLDVHGGTFNTSRFVAGQRLYLSQSGTVAMGNGAFTGQFLQAGGGDGLLTELGLDHVDTSPGRHVILEYRTGMPASLAGDLSNDVISRPLDVQWIEGDLAPGGPTGVTGGSWTMTGAGDYDGIVVQAEVMTPAYDLTQWTVVLPPVAAGTSQFQFPRLPSDLLAVWANQTVAGFTMMTADTAAASYAEFRRDAAPELPWQWIRAPVTPSKVRVGISYGAPSAFAGHGVRGGARAR